MPNGAMPPQGAPQPAQQGGGAEQAIQMIQAGFQALGKLIQAAQGQLDPQDVKLFQQAVQATDAFIQALTSDGQGQAPQRPQQSGPMPANANAGAKPMPNQG